LVLVGTDMKIETICGLWLHPEFASFGW